MISSSLPDDFVFVGFGFKFCTVYVTFIHTKEDVRNFGSKDIIGASNPGLYHDHENNQYQHETQIS